MRKEPLPGEARRGRGGRGRRGRCGNSPSPSLPCLSFPSRWGPGPRAFPASAPASPPGPHPPPAFAGIVRGTSGERGERGAVCPAGLAGASGVPAAALRDWRCPRDNQWLALEPGRCSRIRRWSKVRGGGGDHLRCGVGRKRVVGKEERDGTCRGNGGTGVEHCWGLCRVPEPPNQADLLLCLSGLCSLRLSRPLNLAELRGLVRI